MTIFFRFYEFRARFCVQILRFAESSTKKVKNPQNLLFRFTLI
ncbi:hypothetical protein [Helicobacter sp. 23-1045]